MNQSSYLTRTMAEAQEAHTARARQTVPPAIAFDIYVSGFPTIDALTTLIVRYFRAATITQTVGLWEGISEFSAVVRIVGQSAELQTVVHLAGDLRIAFAQSAVLVTWQSLNGSLLVDATSGQ